MTAARKLQEPAAKKFPKLIKSKPVDVLLQNLGGRWFAFWELNGEVYYQVCPVRVAS